MHTSPSPPRSTQTGPTNGLSGHATWQGRKGRTSNAVGTPTVDQAGTYAHPPSGLASKSMEFVPARERAPARSRAGALPLPIRLRQRRAAVTRLQDLTAQALGLRHR